MDTATSEAPAQAPAPKKAPAPTRTPDEWARTNGLWNTRRGGGAMPEHAAVITLRGWDGAHDKVTEAQYRAALRAYRMGPA